MNLTSLLLLIDMWLLCLIFIITGLTRVNTSWQRILGFGLLLTVGVVLVLFSTILLVGKMFLWIIAPELAPILQDLLQESIKNNNYVLTGMST
jgi:hypothetical protein